MHKIVFISLTFYLTLCFTCFKSKIIFLFDIAQCVITWFIDILNNTICYVFINVMMNIYT